MYEIDDIIITNENYNREVSGNDNSIKIIGKICKITISKGFDQIGRDLNHTIYSIYGGSFTLKESEFSIYKGDK